MWFYVRASMHIPVLCGHFVEEQALTMLPLDLPAPWKGALHSPAAQQMPRHQKSEKERMVSHNFLHTGINMYNTFLNCDAARSW